MASCDPKLRDKLARSLFVEAAVLRSGHTSHVLCLAASPDGGLLASGSADTTVRLWRLPSGAPAGTLTGHSEWVWGLAASPDGQLLASGSLDRTVRLWWLPFGEPAGTLRGHRHGVGYLVVSPDGGLMASASYDETVRLWQSTLPELSRTPVDQISLTDIQRLHPTTGEHSDDAREWVELITALVRWRHQHDIEVDAAPGSIEVGDWISSWRADGALATGLGTVGFRPISASGGTRMAIEDDLDVYLRARYTLIVLVTVEEERALRAVTAVCERLRRPCLAWDLADGFEALHGWAQGLPSARDPLSVLEQVEKIDGDATVVLKDFHDCWGNAQVKRKLRSAAQRLKFTRKSIVIVAPTRKLPDELRDEAVVVELPLPDSGELGEVIAGLTQIPDVKVNLTPAGREKLGQAALGMTAAQARRVIAEAIVRDGALDDRHIDVVVAAKKEIIRESEALEYYPVSETPDDVGGLGVLKQWLRLRERAFTQEARDYGLPAPKGIALIGIPGTGKSLTAKMIGGLWRLPLLRLDVGALFGSLVGEAEERTRRALQLAETVAPCVVWIDEMEKALAHGGGDSGTSTRVFGTILTWMQEKTAPCFVVGTANDVASLPPEVLRKGRFDEIFFLDLPTVEERAEILAVHLRKRRRLPGDFDVEGLARRAEGYVGAEIEQAIVDAMYVGFNEDREFVTADILDALDRQVPLSTAQREIIGALREWLREGRAQSASFTEIREAERQFVRLEI